MLVRRRMFFLAVSFLVTSGTMDLDAGEAPARPTELKALDIFLGTWDTQATVKVAEWTPKEVRTTSSIKLEWVLGERVIQGKGSDSLKEEFLVHWTYDVNLKAYRMWFFTSGGAVVDFVGQFVPGSKAFVMKKDLGNGIMDTFTIRATDADTIEFRSQAKGGDGKIYFAMEGKWARRK